MKRILLFLMVTFCCINIHAQDKVQWFETQAIDFKTATYDSGWTQCDKIKGYIDYTTQHIELYSKSDQVFDYTSAENSADESYEYVTMHATDVSNGNIIIVFCRSKQTGNVFLSITYADCFYMYKIKWL